MMKTTIPAMLTAAVITLAFTTNADLQKRPGKFPGLFVFV